MEEYVTRTYQILKRRSTTLLHLLHVYRVSVQPILGLCLLEAQCLRKATEAYPDSPEKGLLATYRNIADMGSPHLCILYYLLF